MNWDRFTGTTTSFIAPVGYKVRMKLYTSDRLTRLIYCAFFEWQERALMVMLLRPDDVFIDVGANVGLHTLTGARQVGPRGRVLAFEPDTDALLKLKENVFLASYEERIRVQPFALGEKAVKCRLNSVLGQSAWSYISAASKGEEIEVKPLDAVLCSLEMETCALLKVDVEGSELKVLHGAKKLLTSSDPPILLIEFSMDGTRATGQCQLELFDYIAGLGYRQLAIHKTGLCNLERKKHRYTNALCIPSYGSFQARWNSLLESKGGSLLGS